MEENKMNRGGYVSIDYKGVRYIRVNNPDETDYESIKYWLSSSPETNYAVINQKTFAYIEKMAWEDEKD